VVLFGAFPKQGNTSASAYFSAHLLLSSVFLVRYLVVHLWNELPAGPAVHACLVST
jgi:hypothetical protein